MELSTSGGAGAIDAKCSAQHQRQAHYKQPCTLGAGPCSRPLKQAGWLAAHIHSKVLLPTSVFP